MEKKFKTQKVSTSWIKINDIRNGCFVGNDTIAFNLTSHIIFTSLLPPTAASGSENTIESYYRADCSENGDGIACIAGHKVFPIFAFAESCCNARIFILSYPDFTNIAILECKEDMTTYIGLAFSETEHLVALTGKANYNKLQVWYWRTREMLKCQETELLTDKQTIACSSSLPLTVAQFAYKKGELNVWEIHGTQKFCKLIRRKIRLDFEKVDGPFSSAYSIEGNILIANRHGDIYNVVPSSSSVNLISTWLGEKSENAACLTYVRNGILISGPDGIVKFFKRQKFVWNEIFQQKVDEAFVTLKCYHDNETVIATTAHGGIYRIHVSEADRMNITKIRSFDDCYDDFSMIYPSAEHFVAVNREKQIHIVEVATGNIVSNVKLKNNTVIRSNPRYPFIAVGSSSGDVTCVSVHHPTAPTMLTEFLLSRRAIVDLRFSDFGNFLTAMDSDSNFFIIKSTPGAKMAILSHSKLEIKFTDSFSIESFEMLHMYFLLDANSDSCEKSKILKVDFHLFDVDNMKFTEFQLDAKYLRILPIFNAKDKLYGIRQRAREVDVVEIYDNDGASVRVASTVKTPHLMRHVEGHNDGYFLVTWSMDGIVAMYEANKPNTPILASFIAGNRHKFGLKMAHCNARGDVMLTMDNFGNIVCTKIESDYEVAPAMIEEIDNNLQRVEEAFAKPTSGGFPGIENEYFGKKFTDLKNEEAYQMEAMESEETRRDLLSKIEKLRGQISRLLDMNEKLSEEERLPIENFNLDLKTKAQMELEAQNERDNAEKKMADYIGAQTAINQWIIDKCWHPMDVKGAKLRGMFVDLFVENYPLLKKPEKDDDVKRISLMRAIENSVAQQDVFLPWRPIPTIELEKILIREPGMYELDVQDLQQYQKTDGALIGTNTHKIIDISPLHYQQLDVVTFHQMRIEKILVEKELRKLKDQFNEKFQQMHRTKLFQINSIRFKNNRLRHIQNELRVLDELRGLRLDSIQQILDPDFQTDEQPDSVVHVVEAEVCVAPYISPSYLEQLEQQEAARERRRKEMEADDFRDRALDCMMDGVLEHKWEDEIKKSPKIPNCLVKNKPKDEWSEIEEKEVEDYHRKLEHVMGEREKYRKMLFDEQKLLQGMLDQEIHAFNYNLGELTMEKLKMDMIIGQEEMKLLLATEYNFKRIFNQRKEIEVRLKMEETRAVIEKLTQLQIELQEIIRDMKNAYENLQVKDKTLEKQFKANFSEACPGAPVDQAFKYFKRRPKLQMRAQITSPILMEVAKRVASKKIQYQVKLLPSECVEYLNGVDVLDQVASSTTGIDVNSWSILCKMRRVKIESEFRIKSLGLQLADAESALTAFTREANNKRILFQSHEKSLSDVKDNRENDSINRFVQLVMQRGLIEIPLSGSFSDFNDSILVHRSDVDDINKIIIKAGMKKLRALENSAMFSRKITLMEWEHKVLKLKVRDLEEFVKTIEKVKITKEVQAWLKRKERGWSEDLSEDNLNRQIENTINSQERILSEISHEIHGYEKRIDKKKREIKHLDDQISMLNIDVSEQNLLRDVEFERGEIKSAKERMAMIIERAKLVRLIQHQHSQLLQLTTLLELQRLKTYPTLTQIHSGRYLRQA